MNKLKYKYLFVFLLFISNLAFCKTGTIRGVIIDKATGETLPGVNVMLEETSAGAVSDLDGNFILRAEPGTWKLKISFVSYTTLIISDVVVKENEVTNLGTISLSEAVNELSQVNVTAEMIRNNENAILAMKQKSANMIDGISSDNIKKIGDSDAGSTMKRVTGVSVMNGKYVFVRGLGDRYTKSILNGMEIPGLDPDRNTLQMDIFPTNILDNIIVHKTFIPELPADFTGGIIDISLKEFPDKKSGTLALSGSYNPQFHLNENYITYQGGKTDFLGFDDGTRAIPATSNIPFFTDALSDPNGAEGSRYKEILGSFNPTMAAMRSKSFMDYSFGFDLGNQVAKKKVIIGYNLVFNYKNESEFYSNTLYGRYGLSADPSVMEMEVRDHQEGDFGLNNIMLSGMAGFAIKTQNSKFKINVLHLQNGESKAGIFDYESNNQGAVFYGYQHNLEYSQRGITNILLNGKHNLSEQGIEIEWKISPTLSRIEDPDIRFTRYELRNDQYFIGTEAGFPQRIWRELYEQNLNGLIHLSKNFKFREKTAKIKGGASYSYKIRDYVLRSFNLNIRNVALTGNPDELFQPENLWPLNGDITSGTTYEATFLPVNSNKYNASAVNLGIFLSAELNLSKKIKTIVGTRVESFRQHYTGRDQLGLNDLKNEEVLNNLNLFPSVNLIYTVDEKNNIRGSYTKTIARPSFKELSYAEIYDPITGRTFIGGLFRDENIQTGQVYWDGELVSTDIQNIDFRWEFFPSAGQTISTGLFYKSLSDPIEIVQFASQAGAFQPRNVGDGQILGAEFELRKNLKFISQSLADFSLAMNFTWIESRIRLSATEYESRVANARSGQMIGEYREMAGQAPYLINGGITYNGGKKGFLEHFEAGLFYNVQGKTLQYVGIADRPDIFSNTFHSLNMNLSKKFGEYNQWNCGIKIENLLKDKIESVYSSYNSKDQFFTKLDPGQRITLRLSYNIFRN